MEERGDSLDSDSDETVVEGSLTESDVEGEEFCRRRWLYFPYKDVRLTTQTRINEGNLSPEICFIQKFYDHTYARDENQILQEEDASDQSQSLLHGWISCPSLTENISKPDFSANASVVEQQDNSADVKLNGFQKDSEEKISPKLGNEDLFPETSPCLDVLLEDMIMVPKEQDTLPHDLEGCLRMCMTMLDTDNIAKDHSSNNNTDLSQTSPGKIFMETLTKETIETGEFTASDLLISLDDSDSLKMIKPLFDKLESPGQAFSIDPSPNGNSDTLPVQLVTALDALSGSVEQPVTPVVPNETQLNTEAEQLCSEPCTARFDDESTQITNVIDPQLATVQVDETKALTGSNLQRTTNEQTVDDQQREKEVVADYWDAISSETQTGEGSSCSAEAAACVETALTTLRETSPQKCRDDVPSHQHILEQTHQSTSQSGREAFRRNSVKPCHISRSIVNRRNAYGETLLHRAVAHQDVDLVQKIIKVGGKVNIQDYAGWTALHIASLNGCYDIANALLKAGADVNARGNEQVTPLQDAVKEGHYEMAELLLWYGADPLLKNEMGRSALEEASNSSMRKLLNSYTAKSGTDSVPGGDDSKNMNITQSAEDTNLHQISLQTNESEPVCASLTDSDSMKISQQMVVNEVQNIYTNKSEDGTSCNEHTLQENPETLLAQGLSAATNGETVSRSPFNSTSGTPSTQQKAPQPENGGRILLNAEESVEGYHMETENVASLEIEPVALQLHEKDTLSIRQKRDDLQETNSKADLCSGVNAARKSRCSFQIVETMQKETTQKTESSIPATKKDVILHGTCNTRAERRVKTKRNAKGETELHIAAGRGNLPLVKALISSGVCVNDQDYAGWTAIHEAANKGFTEVIIELLKAGANVNSRSLDGILPIHDAVSGNYLEAVRILLQHGANPLERDASGKRALDEACNDEMKELLKSYGAGESVLPVPPVETTQTGAKWYYSDYSDNDDVALEPQHEKYSVETLAAIQDAQEKQKELLLLELRTSKDADVYTQRLSQMQDTLNEMLAKQKTERDMLAKKYRASVESFKKGALRKQLANLASKQKCLLTVAQTQEKLVQKIRSYRKTKKVFSASCSGNQISNVGISHGNDKSQSLTADEVMCLDAVAFSKGLGASMPNGETVEADLSSENRFSAQKCNQHPHICLGENGGNKEATRSKEASDHPLTSENRVGEYPFDNISKLTGAVEVVSLPSETTGSPMKIKCSQQKDIDCAAIAERGNKSLNSTSVTNALNIVKLQSTVVNSNVCHCASDCQQVLTDGNLHGYINKKEAFQQHQQQVILSTSTKNFPNILQQISFQSSENSLNGNLGITDLASNTDYPVNLVEKFSQSYSNQGYKQKQEMHGRKCNKKLQLVDLLVLGRIKPGENVLEFKLQEISYKATVLKNGKIRTSKGKILQSPVLWVKDVLGSDIPVTWKYVWNKVTYLGTPLSKLLVEEGSVSSDLELQESQEREPLGSSVQFSSVESLTHFPQFNQVLMVRKEEFLPCSVMEKYWNFYKGCENFGF
ncbi:ankyrin repeat domain-containing protein 31 [Phaethornis superciliosus]